MVIIPAQLDSLRTLKDKTLKVTFETNELNPEQLFGLMENLNQFGYLAFKKELFAAEEKIVIENLKTDIGFSAKSSSQRLRAVLFRMFENNQEGFNNKDEHYEYYMNKVIKHFKDKLP